MATTEQQNKRNPFRIWQMILLPIILSLIPLVYPEIKAVFERKQPQFVLERPVVRKGDASIFIYAENNAARKKENLVVEIGGLEIKDGGKLISEEPLSWEFRFLDYDLPRTILGEGLNTLTVSFPGGNSSNQMSFYIDADFFQQDIATIDVSIKGRVESLEIPTADLSEDVSSVKIVSTSSHDDPRVGVSMTALRGQGVNKAYGFKEKVEHITPDMKGSEIRYFNKGDKRGAEKLKRFYKDNLNIDCDLMDYSEKLKQVEPTKGAFEVWIQ